MINSIQRLAITLLIFSSFINIASAQMTDEAEVESTPSESQTENQKETSPTQGELIPRSEKESPIESKPTESQTENPEETSPTQ